MRRSLFVIAGTLSVLAAPAVAANGTRVAYPEPPRANVVDTFWSTPVPDPYRPLETERPDLFAAATTSAGVYDMVRFPKTNAGAATATEMGRADESEAAFRALYAYSPLHNVRPGTSYPAMLIATGDRDDRVSPGESYKFAAALQHAQAGDAPILLRVTPNAGHDYGAAGSGPNPVVDRYAFLFRALKFEPRNEASR